MAEFKRKIFNFKFQFKFLFKSKFLGFVEAPVGVLESTHVVEQHLFSMFPSILIFDSYLILGSFFNFWGPNGLFLELA